MSVRRGSSVPVCLPCGKPGTLHGPAVALKFTPKRPAPLTTGVALNEVAWKDDKGEEVECTICAYPMSADSGANPWTGPGLFLTQACVNGHVYHKGCLLTHMSRSNSIDTATCPECRNPILSEVAASLRRNGAPAPVPAPAPSSGGGGGLFSGGGGGAFWNLPPSPDRLGGDNGWVDDYLRERGHQLETAGAERRRAAFERLQAERAAERTRLENEERRAAQLPYRSLAPLPPMTGVNGHFFLVGGLNANPTPLEIKQALRYRVQDEPTLYADKLHLRMSEQNLDPFHNPPNGGMKVTLVQYEFNGLTDEEGDDFLAYYRNMAGDNGELSGSFYQEFFDLPTTPLEGANGAPKWGEGPWGDLPPSLNIAPVEYDAWARVARREREELEREAEELRDQQQEALLQQQFEDPAAAARFAEMEQRNYEQAAAGPRTRARSAAEAAAREEREQLDDF